jgi:murein DD-endopeptidase MepM/ murein hydrolase activator NlpD
VSGLRAIRARALRVLPLAVAGVAALAAGAALGASPEARTTASAYAVLINVPGAQSSGTLTSPGGSYQYRDLVAIHSYTAGSALSGERAYGHSDLSGITLLGGVVTADSILSRTYADGRKVPATGSFGGTVSGLVVAGAAVSVQPGGQFPIPGIGWGAVDERRVVRSDGAYRGSEVALHIRLSSDWHSLPAGTPLVAVQSGVLHNVGWNRLGGWRLWVEDEHGNWFYYAHLSAYSPIATEGAHVNAGDVVGFVGNTGDAAGGPTHVHFEIHPGGKWAVPPYDYLQAWQGHRNPFAAIPSEPPPVAAAQLGSTDISAASGLDTAAVLAVASGAPAEAGLVALGVPAPTAAELLAATPSP